MRKIKRSGGEAVCYENPPLDTKMTGNQLDVKVDHKQARALVDSGTGFLQLSELLRTFFGIFTKTGKLATTGTNVKHLIHTGNQAPINQKACRVSKTERCIIRNEVQKMLEKAQETKVLGHLVSGNGRSRQSESRKQFSYSKERPRYTNLSQTLLMLSKFIKAFCNLAEPLQLLLKGDAKFHWSSEEIETLESPNTPYL
ncbi:hypothetical protein TNCT_429871 [Trichonephila clavata]|uniref:Uncharacterized protein n=1 Tax=Trichonephila clavata TaxID=2740835 RepID=A0A8X6GS72_TRICU|nr:hypothetical protein TNCT_429871 [Trichonephila clavata]